MHLSLHTKLRDLRKYNESDFSFVRDPRTHKLPGEGRLMYKGKRIEIVADYIPPKTPNSALDRLIEEFGQEMAGPHDVAWCPEEKTVLAAAKSEHEPFSLLEPPVIVKQ